jgi:hypothetical protein
MNNIFVCTIIERSCYVFDELSLKIPLVIIDVLLSEDLDFDDHTRLTTLDNELDDNLRNL